MANASLKHESENDLVARSWAIKRSAASTGIQNTITSCQSVELHIVRKRTLIGARYIVPEKWEIGQQEVSDARNYSFRHAINL